MAETKNNDEQFPEVKPTKPGNDTAYIAPIIGKLGYDTRRPWLFGLGTSPNNGVDFHVFLSFDGLNFDDNDIDKIWNGGTADKVKKEVDSATAEIPAAVSAANSAVSAAESAVAASKVNSDAIVAQSKAISEAKAAMDSATAEIQQTAANAASDAAKIRADVAKVQNEVDTAKTANSASVEALKSDVSAAKQDIQAARQANENFAKQLDDYTKQAQAQGKTIKDIQDAQDGYTATLADVKGNVSKISDTVDGLSASLKDGQDNVATIKAKADELSATLTDHDKNIAQLTDSVKELSSTLEDAGGRLSKVEQTATALSSDVSDQQGRISKVEQKATGTEQTVANQQGQINTIKTDAAGIHETLTGQGDQIANINVTLNGLNTKYEGVSGDLGKLKSQAQWITVTSAVDLNNVKTPCHEFLKGTVTNAPNEAAWWYLTVESSDDGNRVTQTVIADQSNNRYTRRWADVWSAWVKDATQTDVTDLSNRITTNSTQITQNQQAIALKADQSTVNNLSGEVSQNKAQLKVQAGQISSKVSSEDFKTLNDKVGNLQAGSQNLVADGDASAYGATVWENTAFRTHQFYYNSTKNMFVIDTTSKTEVTAGCPNWFPVKAGQQYTLYFNGFMSTNVSSYDVWLLGKKADNQGDWTDSYQIITGERLSPSNNCIVTRTFTVPSSWDNHVAYVRFDNNGSTDGHSAVFFFNEVSLKEGNINTGYSPALEDSITLIKKNATAIDQTDQKISLKADQTEVDKVKNTASQNSSRLNVMAGEISSKVTSTDVNNIVNSKGYATTSTVQSLITQKAGTINESITNLDAKYKDKDGVNLVRASGFHNVTLDELKNSGWSLYGKDWINKNGGSNKQGSIVIDATSITTGVEDIVQTIPLEPDTDYTLSFHLIYESTISGKSFNAWSYVVEEDSNGNAVSPYVDHNCPMANSDDRKQNTRTFHTSKDTHQGVLYLRAMAGTKIELEEVKLEHGSVATPWTPAPSDNATVTQVQSLTASIDGLQSTVANKADKSQITQLSNTIQSKVSTADFNSKITQLSNDINLRVTKDDLLGQINIRAGNTLIQNGKIYLDANSIVFGKNSRAIIPSAAIGNLDAAKITTGSISVPMSDGKDNSISFEDDGVVIKSKGKSSDFYDANEGTSKLKITGAGIEFISSTDNDESIKRLGIMTPSTYQNVFTSGMSFVVTGVGDSSSGTLNDRGAFFSLARKTLSYPLDYKGMIYATGEMGDLDTGFHFNDPVYIHPYGAETGIRSTWCSWSSMGNRKFPVLVNSDYGWSGIAFPIQGQAFVFSNNGYVARPNQKIDSYNGYGEGNRDYFDSTDPNQKH